MKYSGLLHTWNIVDDVIQYQKKVEWPYPRINKYRHPYYPFQMNHENTVIWEDRGSVGKISDVLGSTGIGRQSPEAWTFIVMMKNKFARNAK